MKKILLGSLYFPIAAIVSLFFGIVIGVIGKSIGNFQDFRQHARREFRCWKRYPKKNNVRYMKKSIGVAIENRESSSEISRIESAFKSGKETASHPFVIALSLFGFYTFLTFFSCLAGMIEGPERVFEWFREVWHVKLFNEPFMPSYERRFRDTVLASSDQ